MLFKNLKSLVKKNSLLWGEDVAEAYHGAAADHMKIHWSNFVQPVLDRHGANIDFAKTIDFACGYGRNTDELMAFAANVIMVDVNKHNLKYCREKYATNPRVTVVECNGYDLRNIESGTCTFFYTFDSVVHFPLKLVRSYLPEISRVMSSGGYALIHHSNYTDGGNQQDFRKNPHWRNYMSAEIFASLAKSAGFVVVEQTVHDWGVPNLDCVSVLKKP